jgi:hypothetical protein
MGSWSQDLLVFCATGKKYERSLGSPILSDKMGVIFLAAQIFHQEVSFQ